MKLRMLLLIGGCLIALAGCGGQALAQHYASESTWQLTPRVAIYAASDQIEIRVQIEKYKGERIQVKLRDGAGQVLISYNVARRKSGVVGQSLAVDSLPDDVYEVEVNNGFEVVRREFKLTTSLPVVPKQTRELTL